MLLLPTRFCFRFDLKPKHLNKAMITIREVSKAEKIIRSVTILGSTWMWWAFKGEVDGLVGEEEAGEESVMEREASEKVKSSEKNKRLTVKMAVLQPQTGRNPCGEDGLVYKIRVSSTCSSLTNFLLLDLAMGGMGGTI